MNSWEIALVAYVLIVPAICVSIVAESRGWNSYFWFFYELLVWPIALTHVLTLPRK